MNEIASYVQEPGPEPESQLMAADRWPLARGSVQTVFVLDRHGFILETNELVAPLTGYDTGDLVGMRLGDLLDPGSRAWLDAIMGRRRLEGSWPMQATITGQDGRRRPVRGELVGMYEEDGEFSGLVARLERKLVLAVVEETKDDADVKELADQVGDAVLEVDAEGEIAYLNPAGAKSFGYPPGERPAGLTLDRLFDPLASSESVANLLDLSPQKFPLIVACRRRDGRRFLGRIAVAGKRHGERGGGWRLVVQDLSPTRDLERWGRRLQFAAGIGRFGFAALDRAGRILFADPSFAAWFGSASGEEMAGLELDPYLREREDRKAGETGPDRAGFRVAQALLKPPAANHRGRCPRVALVTMGEFQLAIVAAG